MSRIIAHVDMDAFYASVEQRDHPELKGKPVIVGGSAEQRGVVAAASYEARKFGVHSAMPTVRAMRLCPHAIRLPSNFARYREVSKQIRDIFHSLTPLVEPLSLDEAFLDLSGKANTVKEVKELALSIKQQIRDTTQLIASVGVAPNKFLAKIASDQNKPDGLFIIRQNEIEAFLDKLPLKKLWGVGPATRRRLEKMGIETMAHLRQRSLADLVKQLGSHGAHLWKISQGQDDREVTPDRPYKNISRETTFAEDLVDRDVMKATLQELCESTINNVRKHNLQGKTLHIKVRLSDFTTLTRNITLSWPTQNNEVAWHTIEKLFDQKVDLQGQGVRLLGVGVSGITDHNSGQLPLFPYEKIVGH